MEAHPGFRHAGAENGWLGRPIRGDDDAFSAVANRPHRNGDGPPSRWGGRAAHVRDQKPSSRPISSFMISLDPAQIFETRASRQARATRYSFMKP